MKFLVVLLASALLSISCSKNDGDNSLDQFDPKAPNAEEQIEEMIQEHIETTGESPRINAGPTKCYQKKCNIFVHVDKENQILSLYVKGNLAKEWPVSTGLANVYETPDLDSAPDYNRIFKTYDSKKFPGGGYTRVNADGSREYLGNMPFAMFIRGGYAIHGTGTGNWTKLGRKASHGCIRVHPDNAEILNKLVRANASSVWITVE